MDPIATQIRTCYEKGLKDIADGKVNFWDLNRTESAKIAKMMLDQCGGDFLDKDRYDYHLLSLTIRTGNAIAIGGILNLSFTGLTDWIPTLLGIAVEGLCELWITARNLGVKLVTGQGFATSTACLSAGLEVKYGLKQFLVSTFDIPVDLSNMEEEKQKEFLIGVGIIGMFSLTVSSVRKIMVAVPNSNGVSKVGSVIFDTAKVCAADGTATAPVGGFPEEMIGSNTRFPKGYDGSGKYYFKQHPDYSVNVQWQDLHKKYPNGIRFNAKGYPIFQDYASEVFIGKKIIVDVEGLNGSTSDFTKATNIAKQNKLLPDNWNYDLNPDYTWHHVENGKTMILIKRELHSKVAHNGGANLIRTITTNLQKACK